MGKTIMSLKKTYGNDHVASTQRKGVTNIGGSAFSCCTALIAFTIVESFVS